MAVNTTTAAVWSIRLLLAAVFLFGSEILLWTDPTGRPLIDWLVIVPLYIMIATVILDLLSRYRLRDLSGVMTLAGIYSLLNALLINPDTSLMDIPRTLVTRVTGAHALIGLEMLLLFLVLTGGHLLYLRRILLVGAVGVGLAWGTWVRWSPLQTEIIYEAASQTTMLGVGIGGLAVILLLTMFTYGRSDTLTPQAVLLSNREWMLFGIMFVGLLLIRIAQETINASSLLIVGALLLLCWAVLWFRRGTKLQPLIENHLPVRPLPFVWTLLIFLVLIVSGVLAYNQSLIGFDQFNQLTFVVYGFTLYGLAWLPAVSLWIGLRAYLRQMQSRPL